jgi:hypothetical protein
MAYVFDSINQAVNGGGQAPSQSDIFNSTQPAANLSAQAPQSAGTAMKTTTDADLNNIGPANTGTAKTNQAAATNQNAAAAVAKNQSEYTGVPSNFSTAINKINSDLQSQADSYTQTQAAKGSAGNVDDATLQAAVSGNTDAGSKVRSRLNQAAPIVDPYQNSVNTAIPDLASLNTQAGLSNLLSRNAGAGYTSGLSNLDSMLMGQNQNFIKERQNLNDQQTALNQRAANTDSVTNAAQAAANSNFQSGTGLITNYLNQQEAAIKANAANQMANYNSQQAKLAGGDPAFVKAQQQAALAALQKQAASQPYEDYLSKVSDVDPSQYFSVAPQATDASQFYDQDAAQKYSTIEALLGNTGVAQLGSLAGLSAPQESFNLTGYQQALGQGAQKLYASAQQEAAAKEAAAQAQAQAAAKAAALVKRQTDAGSYDPGSNGFQNILNALHAIPGNLGTIGTNTYNTLGTGLQQAGQGAQDLGSKVGSGLSNTVDSLKHLRWG